MSINFKAAVFLRNPPEQLGFSSTSSTTESFTGDGVTTEFTVTGESVELVHINGILLDESEYSVSGQTVTISPAPDIGSSVRVQSSSATVAASTAPEGSAYFTPSVAGAGEFSENFETYSAGVISNLDQFPLLGVPSITWPATQPGTPTYQIMATGGSVTFGSTQALRVNISGFYVIAVGDPIPADSVNNISIGAHFGQNNGLCGAGLISLESDNSTLGESRGMTFVQTVRTQMSDVTGAGDFGNVRSAAWASGASFSQLTYDPTSPFSGFNLRGRTLDAPASTNAGAEILGNLAVPAGGFLQPCVYFADVLTDVDNITLTVE